MYEQLISLSLIHISLLDAAKMGLHRHNLPLMNLWRISRNLLLPKPKYHLKIMRFPEVIPVSYTHLDVYKRQLYDYLRLLERWKEEYAPKKPEDDWKIGRAHV